MKWLGLVFVFFAFSGKLMADDLSRTDMTAAYCAGVISKWVENTGHPMDPEKFSQDPTQRAMQESFNQAARHYDSINRRLWRYIFSRNLTSQSIFGPAFAQGVGDFKLCTAPASLDAQNKCKAIAGIDAQARIGRDLIQAKKFDNYLNCLKSLPRPHCGQIAVCDPPNFLPY